MKEFHIKKHYRDIYNVKDRIAFFNNRVIFVSLDQAKKLAFEMNKNISKDQRPVLEQDLFAMALIEEINHFLIKEYSKLYKNGVLFLDVLDDLNSDKESIDNTMYKYTEIFPPYEVYINKLSIDQYLISQVDLEDEIVMARSIILEEMLLLNFQNNNNAFKKVAHKLFDDTELKEKTSYELMINAIKLFLTKKGMPLLEGNNITEIIQEPVNLFPESIQDQLDFMIKKWSKLLSSKLKEKAMLSLEYLREVSNYFESERNKKEGKTNKVSMDMFKGIEDYSGYLLKGMKRDEYEAYTSDSEWMPSSVMIAKFTLVWLYQLTQKYGRNIDSLDKIPDQEIAILKNRGFNVLWLIGIWQRSHASRRIQQIKNNPEAESSAYAITKYAIYDKIGGWDSFLEFKSRCLKFGIKLAGDMVPNHTSMDSEWIYYHPDRFIHTKELPSPNYTFTGENLSSHEGVEIYLEDHYYDETDASVVFKRIDRVNGDVRYIYHGNDGTSFPWNDTAQINLLNPEAYEALINEIISLSRNFPVIRLDAAMTFVNQHYKRLWYPNVGDKEVGPAIPTRLKNAYTSEEDYKNSMPNEFWRDLIDRLNKENPDTLLIAEAFWQLEGFFVRTLGMHRVYMSAFMKMLYQMENLKYKNLIKETIEYDKEILKRYVNFMSNPDEEPAIMQFGDGDRYFGTTTMLATLPGLPMFGHGQFEGLKEKYGMKYARPYFNEDENSGLLYRHEISISPLLRMRHLFSEIENFYFFDFIRKDGSVNDNTFVYSNKNREIQSLIVYNNTEAEHAHGKINQSAWYVEKHGLEKKTKNIAQVLDLHNDPNYYLILPNFLSKKQRIIPSQEIIYHGLNFDGIFGLKEYGLYVFVGVYEVCDTTGVWRQIYEENKDKGEVEDMQRKLRNKLYGNSYKDIEKYLTHSYIEEIAILVKSEDFLNIDNFKYDELKTVYFEKLATLAKPKTFEKSYEMLKNLSFIYHKINLDKNSAYDENFENILNEESLKEFIVISLIEPINKTEIKPSEQYRNSNSQNPNWEIYLEIGMLLNINLEHIQRMIFDEVFGINILKDKVNKENYLEFLNNIDISLLGRNRFDGKEYIIKEKVLLLLTYMLIYQCLDYKKLDDKYLTSLKNNYKKLFELIKDNNYSLTKIDIAQEKAKKEKIVKTSDISETENKEVKKEKAKSDKKTDENSVKTPKVKKEKTEDKEQKKPSSRKKKNNTDNNNELS